MSSLIRPALEMDLDAITRIYGHYVQTSTATYEFDPPDAIEMRRRWEATLANGMPYFVAEVDRAVAGYAYAGQYRPRPGYRFTLEDSVYVDPDYAGRGLGRMLLAAVIDACRAKGGRQMIAVIGDTGNTASIRLHEAFGFRQVAFLEAVGYKFGRWVDSILMQRAL